MNSMSQSGAAAVAMAFAAAVFPVPESPISIIFNRASRPTALSAVRNVSGNTNSSRVFGSCLLMNGTYISCFLWSFPESFAVQYVINTVAIAK